MALKVTLTTLQDFLLMERELAISRFLTGLSMQC